MAVFTHTQEEDGTIMEQQGDIMDRGKGSLVLSHNPTLVGNSIIINKSKPGVPPRGSSTYYHNFVLLYKKVFSKLFLAFIPVFILFDFYHGW